MSPKINQGDKVIVDKLIFGPRLYKNINFFAENQSLASFRLKGLRGIRHNDIVVFNHASGEDWQIKGFDINSVFVKRCAGLPGDTITITNGIIKNSAYRDTLGLYCAQALLHAIDTVVLNAYMSVEGTGWTVLDFGPLYLPREGGSIILNRLNYLVYCGYIEYETGKKIIAENDVYFLDGERIESYKFLSDYYFFIGDNAKDSKDSRYFGLVPGDFIIGVVRLIF